MGMYNEVYAYCPSCEKRCCIQIAQLVMGFGEFDLSKPDSLNDLDNDGLEELKAQVQKNDFYCNQCEESFNPLKTEDKYRQRLIKELTQFQTESE